ncbi:MAG: sigma 54-interacting transcriptional regulator [Saprospiraceae bacterium]|nr:sigma 54-interacting transcriptional regulator [Saprospiraceae bacterium]
MKDVSEWMLNKLPYQILWLDMKGRIFFANEAVCQNLGYSQREMINMSIFDINPQLTHKQWFRDWGLVQEKKQNYFQTVHRKKNDNLVRVEIHSIFFSNIRKELVCIIIRNLEESNYYHELLQQAQHIASLGAWVWDVENNDITASNEAKAIFGVEDGRHLHPMYLADRFTETNYEIVRENLRKSMQKEFSFDLTLPFLDMNGEQKWLRMTIKSIYKNNKLNKLLGVYQDVSKQKEQEQSLELYRLTINNTQDMIYWLDTTGRIANVNDAVCKTLGYEYEELIGKTIFDIDMHFQAKNWDRHWEEIKRKKTFGFLSDHFRKNKTVMPVEVHVNYLAYAGKEYNCAIIRDITHFKKRELKLNKSIRELYSDKAKIEAQNEYLLQERAMPNSIIGQSRKHQVLCNQIDQVAPFDTTVFINGESGTGKELIADAVHKKSRRQNKPLIKVNCATLPKELIESALFGHEKGSFTGASQQKIGYFELANEGSILLDEIGELPIDLQPKLLRVIQEGSFQRVGGGKDIEVDVRIIAATNRNLEKMVEEGTFREDLYYRLNVFPVKTIPLRDRKEDIPLLVQHFIHKYAQRMGKSFIEIAPNSLQKLNEYSFPGNIRELENIIERAMILSEPPVLEIGEWLNLGVRSGAIQEHHKIVSFDEAQRQHILKALQKTGWRVSGVQGAAAILEINPKTLFAKMKKLGINRKKFFNL